jgi:tetratricopeptide (TPR) repeat protein
LAIGVFLTALLVSACVASLRADDIPLSVLLDRYAADSRDALLCEQIGVAYTRLNDFDKAAIFFKKAVELNPQRISAEKNLGTVLWFGGHKQEAAAVFASLEKRIPADPVPQFYLGLTAYDAKEMKKAAVHFERAGSLASENPDVFPVVIDSYLTAGRFELAISMLDQRIHSGDHSSQVYRWLGDAYDGRMLPERAYAAYSRAIDVEPKAQDNYLALAAFSIEHSNFPFARDILNRGLQQLPGSPKLELELGLTWALQGNFDAARKLFLEASASDTNWAIPLLALGVTELQTGDAESAAEDFRKAQHVEPNAYYCYYLHGLALTRTQRIQDHALLAEVTAELRRAVALDPTQSQPRALLAQTETLVGDNTAAEADFRKALRLNPNDTTALYRLGLLCRKEGKAAEAQSLMAEFRRAKTKSHDEENEFVLILKTVK